MNKIFAVYKPKGPTSADIVRIIKKSFKGEKVGHAGTLDPLARGVLVIGVGREATKKLKNITAGEKEYVAVVKFGMFSETDDEEGEKTEIKISKIPSLEEIKKALKKFKGEIFQKPPVYSAVKIKGREAYKLARRGERAEPAARKVLIKEIEILNYKWPELKIRIITGPGVYIRAVARDLGEKLKTGGYLRDLERTRVGDFSEDDCAPLDKIA